MALVLKDRVKESSSSSGLGSITLGGAFPGYQTFGSAIASGSTVYYTIHNLVPGSDTEWEVGVGTFTSPATLSRDTILSSSTGSKVNFTSGTEGLEVFVTQPAEEAVYLNQATGLVEVGGNGTNTVAFTNINASNVVMVSGTISTNAANATDITNKQYVDGLFSESVSYHEAVLVESPTNLVAVYNQPNGAGNGVGATLTNNGANAALVIDGVSLSNTARVLVYTQSNAVENGVYTVTNPGAPDSPGPGAKWVLTRSTDTDTYGLANPNALGAGDAFFVQSGNTGKGETYVCTTAGTITFGTSNITFAQISSAQIYAAGTGLNLANLTFSIANTAVTAAQYGNDGNVAQITVNAQGQLTNAANVAINASSITVGTLANARTTASDANGASTIVARDTNGSFAANVGTFTTVNATTGNFTNISGNAASLTDINASNITSGTISNARTTGSTSNSASTIVLRDSNGSFGANVVSAASFSGDGTAITAINASNISSGTISNARTTAASANGASTIVQRDSGGNFSANTVTAAVIGDISGGTNINASNISSGTIANARTTASSSNGAATIVLRGASGEFAAGAITGASFAGDGSAISAINASNISTGTIANARTTAASANGASTIVARDAGGNFSANTITATTFSGALSGNGSAISAINASNISSGTIDNARTTAASANGASTIVARDASGNFTANAVTLTTGLFGNGSNTAPSIAFTNSTGTGLFLPAANTIAFTEGGVEAMRIDSSGNVGIGTNSPARRLDVTGSGSTTCQIERTDGTYVLQLKGSGTTSVGALGMATNDMVVLTNNTERMRIFSTGGVSIGNTTDPGATNLSVTGTIAGNGAPLTGINASNIASGTIANARTTAATANGASTIVLRGTSGEFSAGIITADGSGLSAINGSNVTTGTVANARTTAASANGASTIVARDANGSFTANVGTFTTVAGTLSTASQTNITATGTLTNLQASSFGCGTAASGTAGEIRATNNITAYFSSDERLKDNVKIITDALGKVLSIRGVEFDWNNLNSPEDGYFVRKHDVGVIAQEVEKVIPEVVATREDGIKAVKYDRLVPLLIEAIKELKAEVDVLKGK